MIHLPLIMHALRATNLLCVAFIGSVIAMIVLFGPIGALASLLFLPFLWVSIRTRLMARAATTTPTDQRKLIIGEMSRFLGEIEHPTVAMIFEVDDYLSLEEVYGSETVQIAFAFVRSAIEENLTASDITVQTEGARFISALAPNGPMSTEAMLNTCTQIQHALTNVPFATPLPVQLTVSIGFASSSKLMRPSAETLADAALAALSTAKKHAPNAVRGYSDTIAHRRESKRQTARDAAQAFERGEIFAHFQPQIDLDTGRLAGFETLARWHHPSRGIMTPPDFLPALKQAGQMPKLGETMIKQALQALTFWDKAGLKVHRIGVNFSTSELRNPRLVDRIATHLDVAQITPERLNIEILETLISSDKNDDITANLAALADLGCGIDLDDFGTGHASIANIRKFSVKRIKIDRSFINGIDVDAAQRNMVSAILSMADRLGVETLAEGVETRAQRDVLHTLGCRNAQGFQIARPMPIQETVDWANAFFAQTSEPLPLARRAS